MLKLVRVLIVIAFFMLCFIPGWLLVLANPNSVPLDLILFPTFSLPLGLWVVFGFCFGGLFGVLIGSGLLRLTRLRWSQRKLHRRLKDSETKLAKLESLGP